MNMTDFRNRQRRNTAARALRITGDDDSQLSRDELSELAGDDDALNITADYETVWSLAGDLASDEEIAKDLRACDQLLAGRKPEKRWLWNYPVWAAACCLLVLAGLLLTNQLLPASFTTAVGEQRLVVLDDGTKVTLNTATEIAVRYGKNRRIELVRGEAYFDVAHDPQHPFVVSAPGGHVQALGTEFSVLLNDNAAVVTVIEGRVAVMGADSARAPSLSPGQSLTLLRDGTVTPAETVDTAPIRYWREGKIYFNNQRLDTSVSEFNRYLERKVILGNRELGDLHISGVFQVGDLEAFLFALDEAFGITAIDSTNAVVLVQSETI